MSRSIKKRAIKWYTKEAGWARKSYRRRFRKTIRRLTRAGKYDSLPRYCGTCGWDTW
jgi:CelD/BcsL family acetyltransferase involved in cellulose biosynthesis